MSYSLKFGVKIGLYCVKYAGVVVCTGVVIKVSCRQIFFLYTRAGVYVIMII